MPDRTHVAKPAAATPTERRSVRASHAETAGEQRLHALAVSAGASPQHSAVAMASAAIDARAPAATRAARSIDARTGLPDGLKRGVEALSGLSLDAVRVHRGSAEPGAIDAHAFARGTAIHLAPGQERHLPHEAWHVVQQMQGRVPPTGRLPNAVRYNDDLALEREADEMGARALRTLAQRPAATRSAAPPVGATGGADPPIQGAWRCIVNGRPGVAFWLDEKGDPPQRPPRPTAWAKYDEIPAAEAPPYYLAEGKAQRRKEPALKIDQWTTLYGKPHRASSDVYNPFGRFRTEGVTSFMPGNTVPSDGHEALQKRLIEADDNYQAYSSEQTAALKGKFLAKHADASFLNAQGYPIMIATAKGKVLGFVGADDFGAVYADSGVFRDRAQPDPTKVKPSSDLTWKDDVPEEPEHMKAEASDINADTVKTWHGKERDKQQGQVMGVSAGDAAASAGFDRNEGEGWEWLHLVAHSMGGIDYEGPQVAANLVAGTGECNTQMIVVEEFLKDIVTRSKGRAKLCVYASMFDRARHIGDYITYDFVMHDEHGKRVAVYHWRFDCLSRRRPLAAQNRIARYAARSVFGVEEKGENKGYTPPEPGVFVGQQSAPGKPAGGGLEADELDAGVAAMTRTRRAEVAALLGLDPGSTGAEEIKRQLAAEPFDLVLDIIRQGSVRVNLKSKATTIDRRLAKVGKVRRRSDSVGFICLIDSIHQLLAGQNKPVDRAALIAAVRDATGSDTGQMLEIIGAEGDLVLAAVQRLLHETHHAHFQIAVDVTIVMRDGSLVPFYNANTYRAHAGDELRLDLLFVNNNHYEPLFDAPDSDDEAPALD